MSSTRKLLIFGAGEAGSEIFNSVIPGIIDATGSPCWNVAGFVDNDEQKVGTVFNDRIVYSVEQIGKLIYESNDEWYGCCPLMNNKIRSKIIQEQILASGLKLATIIHTSAVITATAKIGEGAIVYPNVIIGDKAKIGYAVIVNYGSVIGHDVKLGEYCFLGPGVILTGRCDIGKNTLLGAGTVFVPGVTVGENCKISSGIVTLHNVAANTTLMLKQNIVRFYNN